jgi:hypothetical protein
VKKGILMIQTSSKAHSDRKKSLFIIHHFTSWLEKCENVENVEEGGKKGEFLSFPYFSSCSKQKKRNPRLADEDKSREAE